MTLPVEVNPLLLAADDGYTISRSLRFRSSASACLTRTYSGTGSSQKFTGSVWVKRGTLSSTQTIFGAQNTGAATWDYFGFNSSNQLQLFIDPGTTPYNVITNAVFRDPSAWYHIVFSVDTTQATAANRVRIYVNGVEQSLGTNTIPQNYNLRFNVSSNTAGIGTQVNYVLPTGTTTVFDGYLAELNWIDGTQLAPSSFGETDAATGVWKPKKYTGTYGTNGFYLNFSDNSSNTATTIGKDSSGNGNNWTPNNISVTSGSTYDSMKDVPTLTDTDTANYCVLNPIALGTTTLSDGNLKAVLSTTTSTTYSTVGITTGKWYWEVTYLASTSNALSVGVNQMGNITTLGGSAGPLGTGGVGYYGFNGNKYVNGTGSSYGATFTTNDVIGIALDATNGTITFYKNNASQGTISLPTLTSSWDAVFDNGSGGGTQTMSVNFGQQPFAYTPPTGFKALNTYNLPTPTIGATASTVANKYFDATLYTGTGANLSITNAGGFQPDFVWTKSRSAASTHLLFDSIRGVHNYLISATTDAEGSLNTTLTAFNSNGFSVGSNSTINNNGSTNVGWQWKANGSGSTNTAGSITSTVSANTTAGFSIVTYTGTGSNATVGHGLGVAPKMVIVKRRDNGAGGTNWLVYHSQLNNGVNPAQYNLKLNLTNATAGLSTIWNDTAPTSTVFSVGTNSETNGSGGTFVAYCFAEVAGYSRFGSYTGNGSSDGPFIYTGFRPRYMLIKRIDTADSWVMMDTARNTYNAINYWLQAESSGAESTLGTPQFDFVSNGMKLRGSSTTDNAANGTYIYAAFAENPFKYSLAR